jgi:beta-lactamase regulating signal transducer with metallopeptidase domain
MNSAIEHLNAWGAPFPSLAGTLLWQSTLLGLVILALDLGLRRRVRAAVRYALWLVLLVKLILPPSLALPTSPAWWWSRAVAPIPASTPQYQFTTVVNSPAELPPSETAFSPLPLAPLPPPPPPALTLAAWSLLAAGGGSLALLGWLILRWRQVVRTARAADEDPAYAPLLAEACQRTHCQSRVRVKITRATLSPAVCGLWRPVILLPQSLTETLAPEQLRAVLMHELMHVRRGDVWVNFAQALLQIIYWWHPLVWVANARIRRLREEAVDDAVMAALRDEADIYAPTLLAVAKFALQRPLASLGLVGILESRSALRQRIERLVIDPAPRRAGLSLAATFGLLVFSAVAVPMGDAPPVAPDLPTTGIIPDPNFPKVIHALQQPPGSKPQEFAKTNAGNGRPDTVTQAPRPGHPAMPVAFPQPATNRPNLFQHTFGVNPHTFPPGGAGLVATPATMIQVRHYISKLGVDLNVPGKSVSYNDQLGLLFVQATGGDMYAIQRALETQKLIPRQIHIKTWFLEVTGDLGNLPTLTNDLAGQTRVGILAAEPARQWLHQLGMNHRVENLSPPPGETTDALDDVAGLPPSLQGFILGEPEVTVTSGRSAQMRGTQTQHILTGINPEALTPPGLPRFDAPYRFLPDRSPFVMDGTNLPVGPILDVAPWVLADDRTIRLTVTANESEFTGYDTPTNSVTVYVEGQPLAKRVSDLRPRIHQHHFVVTRNLDDGQTLVLSRSQAPGGKNQKQPLELINVSIVNPAGDLLHPDEPHLLELPTVSIQHLAHHLAVPDETTLFTRNQAPPPPPGTGSPAGTPSLMRDDPTPHSDQGILHPTGPGPVLDDRPFDHGLP